MKIYQENKIFVFEQPIGHDWKFYLRRLLLPFLDFLYLFILHINRPHRSKKKYRLAICSIFKNEAIFLKEWIEFHRIVGVEHFYMYNNFSDDHYMIVLQPYIEQGLITLIDWPVPQGQLFAYKHCYENFRNEAQWVSFLDIDEFICPIKDNSLREWVEKYKNYPCVVIYWKMFGTSGKINHDLSKLVSEQYVLSWDKFYSVGKVLYNMDYEVSAFDSMFVHTPYTSISFLGIDLRIPPINEFKFFLRGNIHRVGNHNLDDFTIQINHYFSKAYMVYVSKINRGDAVFAINPRNWNYFLAHERHNKISDFKIFRFLIELKDAMGLIQRS